MKHREGLGGKFVIYRGPLRSLPSRPFTKADTSSLQHNRTKVPDLMEQYTTISSLDPKVSGSFNSFGQLDYRQPPQCASHLQHNTISDLLQIRRTDLTAQLTAT